MRDRCDNPSCERFDVYGAMSISYPARWRSFEAFLEDIGTAPDGTILDRIDPNESYSKGNCRWALPEDQLYNRRTQRNNTSGVKGVSFNKRYQKRLAYWGSQNSILYSGSEFWEAVCARKAWEATNLLEA